MYSDSSVGKTHKAFIFLLGSYYPKWMSVSLLLNILTGFLSVVSGILDSRQIYGIENSLHRSLIVWFRWRQLNLDQ